MKLFAVLLLALPAATAAAPLSVAEVVARHRELTGRTIDIDGYMERCKGYDCAITTSEAAARTFQLKSVRISIGFTSDALDRRLDIAAFHHVVLRARVGPECWIAPCTDRAPQVEAIGLVTIFNAAKHTPE